MIILQLHLSKQGLKRVYLLDDSVAKNAKQKQKQKLPVMIVFSPPIQMFSLNEMISINHMDVF